MENMQVFVQTTEEAPGRPKTRMIHVQGPLRTTINHRSK